MSVPGKLRKSELIQAIIQTIHAPETEALAPISPEQAINFSSTDNPLHDVETPTPIRAIFPLQDNAEAQLHAAHVHDGQEDVKQFHSLAVREKTSRKTIERGGEPWFVAADVCRVLGIQNPSDAVKILDEDERARFNLGRQGEANIISESGLYTLKHDEIKSEKGTLIGVRHESLLTPTMSGKTNKGMVHHVTSPDFKITDPLSAFLGWGRVINSLQFSPQREDEVKYKRDKR